MKQLIFGMSLVVSTVVLAQQGGPKPERRADPGQRGKAPTEARQKGARPSQGAGVNCPTAENPHAMKPHAGNPNARPPEARPPRVQKAPPPPPPPTPPAPPPPPPKRNFWDRLFGG